ncbi:response regulator transcription factor [Chryseobacterium sp.]|uniref:helix-turn-helix domain-containing protein n=1 Tax=Chryseobacterium sp. TaxID=1871047 RepID=UPI0025BF325E|nr:response regulator transcription factor [Chryseobacterium sp.]
MPKNSLYFFVFICYSLIIKGQSGPDFTILADKAFQKLYQNPNECISYSQSLLISEQDIEHKIILRNIISQAYALKGDYVQSVNMSVQKDDFIYNEGFSPFLQMFTDYSLADQYQNLGLYGQSKKITARLIQNQSLKGASPKIKVTLAKLYQLQAIDAGITRNYNLAIANLSKSDQLLDSHNEENKIIGIENSIFRSSFLMRTGQKEKAKILLENLLTKLENRAEYNFLMAFAYETLARYYFLQFNYKVSTEILENGLQKIESLPYSGMKTKYYESLAKNYFALHHDEKYHYYNKLHNDLKPQLDTSKKEGIRYIVKLVETYQNNNIEIQNRNQRQRFFTIFSIFGIVILGLSIYFSLEINRNRDLKKQMEFFINQKNREQEIAIPDLQTVNTNTDKDVNKISKEKETEILEKLKELELSDRYLSKNMSLSLLSAQMGINTKYLSEVINTHKGKNFNTYINELRINYIAQLLKTNPVYLNYKVSYLAEVCGFSSHSAFTNVFKSITGMSPNIYIQKITNNRKS